ncbi:MAG: hypothetical protein AAFQ94_04510 [Bacteroidota bacterium]
MRYEVELRSSHLLLSPILSNLMMKDSNSVYVAYKEENQTLLVSPKENSWFPKLHQSQEFMLKSKDLKGTKSISIREILIDHDLNDLDRKLTCTVHDEKKFMKIDFANPA